MREDRHPGNRGKCPFYVDAQDPLTAEASICQCVACATRGDAHLKARRADFRQLAYLTILEETPKYDPEHPSQASFITFMKSRVCHRLWLQRRQELKYLPYPVVEVLMFNVPNDAPPDANPLMTELYRAACTAEALEDEVIANIHVAQFQERLPAMLKRLTEQERKVVELKYYHDYTGTQIAKKLGITKGRVSQMLKCLLKKLKSAYLRIEEGCTL